MEVGRASRSSTLDPPQLRRRLVFLVLGRVVFILLFSVLMAVLQSDQLLEFTSPALGLVGGVVLGVIAASAVYIVLVFRLRRGLYWLAFVQIQLDLVLWGAIISVTGGVNSYFTFLFPLSIVVAAVYLGERGVIFTLVLSVAVYVLVVVARLLDWFPGLGSLSGVPMQPEVGDLVIALTLDIGSMVLVAMLGWVLAFQVAHTGRSLERTQEIFEDLHRLNEAVVTLLPSGLVTTDVNGMIRSANPAVQRILDVGSSALVGRPLHELMGRDHDSVDAMPLMGEVTLHRGGREVLIEYMKAPLQDGTGRIIGSIVHLRDVTEVRRLGQKLSEFEKYRALGDLAVGLAHEIRNPLGSISGSIELVMESKDLDEEDRRLLSIVHLETEKIGRLVTSLFNLARPPDPVIAPVDVHPVVKEITEMCSRDREIRDLTLKVDVSSDLVVLADRDQLGQVIMNLIRNAAEASRGTGDVIVIEGRRLDSGLVQVSVADSGRGMDPELLERIYDPYFTTKSYGLGVGLALCKSIVERHGGTIHLENRPEGGAIARVVLPAG
jgi:two-component system sensor histidine kinase PilS (NtrC family)